VQIKTLDDLVNDGMSGFDGIFRPRRESDKKTFDSTGAAHVDRAYHWREIASDPPTPGLRVQLIHRRDGVAYYGMWREGLDVTHWAALPTFEP